MFLVLANFLTNGGSLVWDADWQIAGRACTSVKLTISECSRKSKRYLFVALLQLASGGSSAWGTVWPSMALGHIECSEILGVIGYGHVKVGESKHSLKDLTLLLYTSGLSANVNSGIQAALALGKFGDAAATYAYEASRCVFQGREGSEMSLSPSIMRRTLNIGGTSSICFLVLLGRSHASCWPILLVELEVLL